MAVKDMTGIHVGKLYVIERDTSVPYAAAYWRCKCECGNEKTIRGTSLRDGSVVDCGCGKSERIQSRIDTTSLLNKRFGRLVALERDLTKPYGHGCEPYWICQCDCGKQVSILGRSLKDGKTKSCGCYRSELTTQNNTQDLTNKRFNMVTALRRTDMKKHGSFVWECKCDCGNICFIPTDILNMKQEYLSCGCAIPRSKGETKIARLLDEHNIRYQQEYTFNDCRNSQTGRLYRYDFAIFNHEDPTLPIRLIEFDGEQHFEESRRWRDCLADIQARDAEKNQYAQQHQIPLVRIPYYYFDSFDFDDLMGDKFLQ